VCLNQLGMILSVNPRGSWTRKVFPSGNHETILDSSSEFYISSSISCRRQGKGVTYRKPDPEDKRMEPSGRSFEVLLLAILNSYGCVGPWVGVVVFENYEQCFVVLSARDGRLRFFQLQCV
jgi:hypothetical protein